MENSQKIYNKHYARVWDVHQLLLNERRTNLVHKQLYFLLELGAKISTVIFAVPLLAREDFGIKELGGKSVREFMREGEQRQIFGTDRVEDCIKLSEELFLTSIDNFRADKLKEMNVSADLKKLSPLKPGDLSLNQKFDKFSLQYKKVTVSNIKNEVQKYNLTKTEILGLSQMAFSEIICIVNSSREKSSQQINVVQFLEDCINKYFPLIVDSYGIMKFAPTLAELRRETKKKNNTLCGRCGKALVRINKASFCNQGENRKCYMARLKEEKEFLIPPVIAITKNKCENCGEFSPFDHIHMHKGARRQFCSDCCWQIFRRKRNKKKLSIKKACI